MESRKEFVIIEPIVASELAHEPIIQKINEIIEYINNYRYRQRDEKDNAYQQQHPDAFLSADIKRREKIVSDLAIEANVQYMLAAAKRESENFNRIVTEFLKHIKFAHLIAVELAVAAASVDILIILLYQLRNKTGNEITDDTVYRAIAQTQTRLLQTRESMRACMLYHQKIFHANYAAQNKNEFYYSDIIINLYEAIESTTGIHLGDERKDLWPDMSYLQTLPALPFRQQSEPETVRDFFQQYITSEPPGMEDVSQLPDSMRHELRLPDEEAQPLAVLTAPDAPMPTNTGCFTWMWSRPTATPPKAPQRIILDSDDDTSESDFAIQQPSSQSRSLDDLVHIFADLRTIAEKNLAEVEKLDMLRREVRKVMKKLQKEIKKLEEPSCFSCFSLFWSNSLLKKRIKLNALTNVYGASTLPELGQRARAELSGINKNIVLAGWNSRTEFTLLRISTAIPAPPVSIDLGW